MYDNDCGDTTDFGISALGCSACFINPFSLFLSQFLQLYEYVTCSIIFASAGMITSYFRTSFFISVRGSPHTSHIISLSSSLYSIT